MADEDPKTPFAHLREASPEDLLAWVEKHLEELNVPAVRQILRNPFLTKEVLELLLGQTRLTSIYEVRKGLARHPRTPQVHGLRLVPTLFWRDLMELGLEPKVSPVVRRAAERQLVQRLSGLAVGEKMAIARRAGHGVLNQLRFDSDPRVMSALLENPRITQGVLMPLVSHEAASPEILRMVAENRRWGAQYPIRLAVVRNPRTPPVVSVALIPRLKRLDLRPIAKDRRLHAAVRRRAQELLDGSGRGGGPGLSRHRI